MSAFLTESRSSQPEGDCNKVSSYPESEKRYFNRVYGSDHLKQLHDDRQEEAILRYCYPSKRRELKRIMNQLTHLKCENADNIAPGRSAYSLKLLEDNLLGYQRQQARSLRWNEHYRKAVQLVAADVYRLLSRGATLKPMGIRDVATSESVQRNLDKNAGYYAFVTGKRSKGENLSEAVEWCVSNQDDILEKGAYGIPLVPSHRSSNSKPTSNRTWKWRCRIILMQDVRALLMDGQFLIPFTEMFKRCPWGEGSMSHDEVEHWINTTRMHFKRYYSSDYSKFDLSQPDWLLEDVFYQVIRPCFGVLSERDELAFKAMVNSYIHKEIHTWFGPLKVDGCQISGSIATYAINTIVNQIVDLTSLLMQGCDPRNFRSLKCGDDNLTFYNHHEPWDPHVHCTLILKYFGIKTTLDESDYGDPAIKNPKFLSREWTLSGAKRSIHEVVWNLVYPERFRDYDPEKTHVSVERAVALVLLAACIEQPATMRCYFDIYKIEQVAEVYHRDLFSTYKALAAMGSGFNDPWIRFKFGNLKTKVSA